MVIRILEESGQQVNMPSPFQSRIPNIDGNRNIRNPQREAYQALLAYARNPQEIEREVGIVLPVGCGKSGTITLTPFAFRSNRTLVVAPGLHIAEQLASDFNPTKTDMFYRKCQVLDGAPYPEPVEIRGTSTNRGDLDEAAVVITNIHQLQGDTNRWIQALPSDYFDLILFDEGHHSVAESWETLRTRFPNARIVNFSATPLRADGQIMAGRILYSYPIFRAIQEGYVKRLKAVQLNPRTLRYVRREDGEEIEVDLTEVRRLGETESDFRRSIVTSTETLTTIVDASIRELDRLRISSGERRLKIIASALNFEHCRQIVEAYTARGQRAGYVHSREDSAANLRVMRQLENHQLDVIVQVRKLGEGFDHPLLAVAAVFSIFSNLSPFVQFVGRIMRVIVQNDPGNVVNQGVVVFHAGANIARQWGDFQQYSEADQAYFDQLLPLEGIDPGDLQTDREITPHLGADMEVRAQSDVHVEEIHLLEEDEAAAIRLLQERGIIAGDFDPTSQALQPVPTTRVAQRQAMRGGLDMRVRTEAARILNQRGILAAGQTLDRQRLGRDNLIVLKSAIDRQVNAAVGRTARQRHEFSRAELDEIDSNFARIVAAAVEEVFNGH
jgi:superfamily II DNA or RNA helicase